jgi:hypothetical protein
MSSQVPVVLVAVIIALFAAPVCTAQELRQPGVHLSIDAPAWLNESQIDTAVDQIRQIWGAAGVTVSSSGYGGSSRPQDARVSVRILTTPARQGATTGAMIMGWVVQAEDGTVAPAMFVSLVGLESLRSRRQLNGVSYSDMPPSIRSRIVAQAVGRVVAHELGHYLLQSAVHSSKGLMRSDFTSAALGDQRIDAFLLGPSESALLRREVTTPALAQRPNATR